MKGKIKNKSLKRFKKWHKWPSLIMGLFILFWAVSGIVLNHRGLFSSLDIDRGFLAKEYQYNNWNNAAVKGIIELNADSILLFGNIGVWLTTNQYETYQDFNNGFEDGIDHRKVYCLHRSDEANVYAGTLFGLYHYNKGLKAWRKVPLNIENERITGITEKDGEIYILSRSYLFKMADKPENFIPVKLTIPPPENYDNKIGLFKTLWVIHSGEIYGQIGKLIVDAFALAFIILLMTGLIHFIVPGMLRRKKKKQKDITVLVRVNRFSYRWHKKIGIWIVVMLLLTTMTGMFLRPPLLIAIASARVAKIPFSKLSDPNPWYDKLRAIIHHQESEGFLIASSEGIYFADEDFSDPLRSLPAQPPVSVMGINVLKVIDKNTYLLGSFNGLFAWNPDKKVFIDYLTGQAPLLSTRGGSPIGEEMVSGYMKDRLGREYYFDYNKGVVPIRHKAPFSEMPENIIQASPMSWWNLALEVHTARFFKFLFGNFYILFIPLFGISMITILVTGLIIWLKLFMRKRIAKKHCAK